MFQDQPRRVNWPPDQPRERDTYDPGKLESDAQAARVMAQVGNMAEYPGHPSRRLWRRPGSELKLAINQLIETWPNAPATARALSRESIMDVKRFQSTYEKALENKPRIGMLDKIFRKKSSHE